MKHVEIAAGDVQALRVTLGRRVGRGVHRAPGTMNKVETAYAKHLDVLKHLGEVRWWSFESVKLKLADKTWFTGDFCVMTVDDVIELHDVKGKKGEGYWCEEDAKIKIKVAAQLFPFRFVIVWPRNMNAGDWGREEF